MSTTHSANNFVRRAYLQVPGTDAADKSMAEAGQLDGPYFTHVCETALTAFIDRIRLKPQNPPHDALWPQSLRGSQHQRRRPPPDAPPRVCR